MAASGSEALPALREGWLEVINTPIHHFGRYRKNPANPGVNGGDKMGRAGGGRFRWTSTAPVAQYLGPIDTQDRCITEKIPSLKFRPPRWMGGSKKSPQG